MNTIYMKIYSNRSITIAFKTISLNVDNVSLFAISDDMNLSKFNLRMQRTGINKVSLV